MKICYLSSPGIHTNRWAKYFADNGHDVHLITSAEPSDSISNVKLHLFKRIGPRTQVVNYPINSVPMMLQFKRMLKNIKPDILHAHYIMETTLLGAASGFHPFVVTPWGSDVLIAPQKSRMSRWVIKYVLKRADIITYDGEHIMERLIELGAEPQKLCRIHWGTNTQKFSPKQRNERMKEDLGILNPPVIISSKNLEPRYDIESLIKSIPLVLKKSPKAQFVIAGSGSQETQMKQLAKSLGVSDSVKFVGFIPSDEFPKYLASADIYVCTSLSDGGLAIATKEAMACQLPVVITDLEVNTEWIENGENGFIVPQKDPKALAEKIIYLIEHEEMRMAFGEKGRRLVKEVFEYDEELKKVEDIYQQLISECKK